MQDADITGDLAVSKSTSGGVFGSFGDQTCVRVSWTRKQQAAASHSSTGTEVISPDAGLRMEELHALTLWDV